MKICVKYFEKVGIWPEKVGIWPVLKIKVASENCEKWAKKCQKRPKKG